MLYISAFQINAKPTAEIECEPGASENEVGLLWKDSIIAAIKVPTMREPGT